jgi:polysaccharide export outer membrane protein
LRASLMLTSVITILLLPVCGLNSQAFGQENAPPKELVQYIRDAKKAGQNDFQIQQNAVTSGWPQPIVNEAIAYIGSTEPAPASKPVAPEKVRTQASDTGTPPVPTPLGVSPAASSGTIPPDKGKTAAEPAGERRMRADRGVPDDYQIGAGDVLEINVWKEPDASVRSVVVRPDGKISMPLLKEVNVVGLTPVQLEKLITDGLSHLINSPDVTIVVTGINSKKIYVNGKVRKEGPIPYTYRMTVMQALSEAGGINDYAKKNRIYVLRNENGKEFRFPFDYNSVLKGQRMELNIPLVPSDIIVVP